MCWPTQTLAMQRPQSMRLTLDGTLAEGLTAKDLALHVIRSIGVRGASVGFLELAGPLVTALEMEARFTLCNMMIEAGARAACIAPDEGHPGLYGCARTANPEAG